MDEVAYTLELSSIYRSVQEDKRNEFMMRFNTQAKSPTALFGYANYLGYLGVDRFVMGEIGLGVLKLLTSGGLGIWALIDVINVAGRVRQQNIGIARDIANTL